ncbi:MAG TPA: hypothetical protein VJS66_01975 [Burkholderiales bacterium]|nr:hypothetical protein [Burkholderiales bacterium]
MKKRKPIFISLLAVLCFVPIVASAVVKTQTFVCGAAHHVRQGGAEMISTALNFRNGDLVNPMTIDRITIRNVFGVVVHDSGPAAGVPHPLNTDFAVPLDITVTPPGASYYLRTGMIWGNFGLPVASGNNEAGQAMSVTIQVSKEGKKELMLIGGNVRARERITLPTAVNEGAEHSRNGITCEVLGRDPN